MGAFFRDQYDLYQEVAKDPVGIISRLRKAILAATGEDLEGGLKDACVSIREHKSYDFAFERVNVLWGIVKEKLEVFEGEIRK